MKINNYDPVGELYKLANGDRSRGTIRKEISPNYDNDRVVIGGEKNTDTSFLYTPTMVGGLSARDTEFMKEIPLEFPLEFPSPFGDEGKDIKLPSNLPEFPLEFPSFPGVGNEETVFPTAIPEFPGINSSFYAKGSRGKAGGKLHSNKPLGDKTKDNTRKLSVGCSMDDMQESINGLTESNEELAEAIRDMGIY